MNNFFRRMTSPTLLRYYFTPLTVEKFSQSTFITSNSIVACDKFIGSTTHLLVLCPEFRQIRSKSKKVKRDEDEQEENYDDDVSLKKDSKVVKFNTTSMRSDLILKTALGIARNKIEQQFYESRIRLNGKKILKKGASVKVGDELDLVKMVSPNNSDHIYVARVEIINAVANEENITLTVRRFKNLLIENYDLDPYKGSSSNE